MLTRVLHIVGRMDRAGAETMLMNLYREIDRSRFQFDFVYFTNERCDFDDEIASLGGRIFRVKGGDSVSRFVNLWRMLREGDWSIVQSHTLFNAGLNLLAAQLAGVPHRIAHSHSTSDDNTESIVGRLYQRVMRWLLARVPTDYVACGKAAAEYLFPDRRDVEIIPNAVDLSRFAEATGGATRSALAIPEQCMIILSVARFMPVKNHGWSVKVAEALRGSGINFQLLFVGNGPSHKAVSAQIEALRLEQHVKLLGLREDIPELMAAADVMLMPSFHEGFPVVLVESQAAGLPAVISSAISAEVDLDVGLVDSVSLDESADNWAKRIVAAYAKPKVELSIRQSALESRGLSSKAGAERLRALYESL